MTVDQFSKWRFLNDSIVYSEIYFERFESKENINN